MVGCNQKVAIVTITNDGYNYGNRLQNYALQKVLEQLGYRAETLNRPIRGNQRNFWNNRKSFIHWLIRYRTTIQHLKSVNFFFWNTRYIHWSRIVASDENLNSLVNQYDFFVAGSDQIWNPKFKWGLDPYMYLQFVPSNKRIAYAASIGIESYEDISQLNLQKCFWQNWRAISVRENVGSGIVEKCIESDVPVLVDPVLLLPAGYWRKFVRHIRTPKRFILVYILGKQPDDYRHYIHELSVARGCQVIDMMKDIKYAASTPSKFVALLDKADYIVTDSFHAFVFSTLFHKEFTFLNRVGLGINMNSRISTLMDKLQMDNHEWDTIAEFKDVDWERVDEVLKQERDMAYAFLKNHLQ